MTRKTLAQSLGFGRQVAKPQPKPPVGAPSTAPRNRNADTGIDAMALSPDDYERRLAQLGLRPPGAEHRRLAPPIDPDAQRVAHRRVERVERRAASDHVKAIEARQAEVTAGAIDGRSATPDEVRARLAAFGVEAHGLQVHPVGRPLDATTDRQAADNSQSQREADRAVARHVHLAMQKGERFDAKRLSPGELRALLELRGAGM